MGEPALSGIVLRLRRLCFAVPLGGIMALGGQASGAGEGSPAPVYAIGLRAVQAAGGVATNWQGGPAHDGGTIIAAGSPELHAEALALLNGD